MADTKKEAIYYGTGRRKNATRAFVSSPAPVRSPLTSATPRITSAARRSSSMR